MIIIFGQYIEHIIQTGAIIIALLIPFLTIERQKRKTEAERYKNYQKCFTYISEIIFYSIKSIQNKEYYKEVLIRSKALNFYQKILSDMKIIYEGIPTKMPSFSEIGRGVISFDKLEAHFIFAHLWVRDNLLILLKIMHEQRENIENITLEINDNDIQYVYDEQKDLFKEKNEIFEILEDIRKEFNLEWDREILNYLKNKS